MKKKIIGVIAVAAIAVAAGWGYQQNKQVELSDLALENVEALASCETIAGSCWMNYSTWECCDAGNYGCSPCGY